MTVTINGTSGIVNNATDLNYTGTLTGGTGVVNFGSGQFYKDASGNVGIGTASPGEKLDVVGLTRFVSNTGATNTGDQNAVVVGATTSGAYAASYGAGLQFQIANTTGSYAGARIVSRLNADNNTANLVFQARNYGFIDSATIDSSGSLIVGTTSNPTGARANFFADTNNSHRAASFESDTTTSINVVLFRNPNGTVGSVGTSGSATTFNTSSDYRLKHDIQPMTGALAKVAMLKPCTYKWNVDNTAGEGFIAHELAEVAPQAVAGEKDAVDKDGNIIPQGIDTSFLVATLTAAIQELKVELDSVKAELATLKGAAQ